HCLSQVVAALILQTNQGCCNLGISLTDQLNTCCKYLISEGSIVINNAIVDYGEMAVISQMRMRIHVGGATVGRPAGVSNANRPSVDGLMLKIFRKNCELAGLLPHMKLTVSVNNRYPSRVISAVFKTA